MGVLMNIYCVPREAGATQWSVLLADLEARRFVRPPYRAGTPFRHDAARSSLYWPENWITPETLPDSTSALPLRDFSDLDAALAYVAQAKDAMVTMDAGQASFRLYPDARDLSAALAVYRFGSGVHFEIGVPPDFSDVADQFPELGAQSRQPKWAGTLTELLWLHGKCVPPEEEFVGSPLHGTIELHWPAHRVLADEFL
ncbi:MAG TPA: hypothetical protein VHE30_14030 [Polyangiaceae bacterium]|nr:hypothetical protein [Polyangiaceae bacterium]